MSPQQQLDPAALAWLQFLQSQAPVQSDLGVGASSKARGDSQERAEQPPTHQTHPDDPVDPEEEDDSETERTATAEDKRRRNTAASGDLLRSPLPLRRQLTLPLSPVPEQEEAVVAEHGTNRHKPITPSRRIREGSG
jgi:hypothetical protein